jgi:hypothetical protein
MAAFLLRVRRKDTLLLLIVKRRVGEADGLLGEAPSEKQRRAIALVAPVARGALHLRRGEAFGAGQARNTPLAEQNCR